MTSAFHHYKGNMKRLLFLPHTTKLRTANRRLASFYVSVAEAEGICSILGPGGSFRNLLLQN